MIKFPIGLHLGTDGMMIGKQHVGWADLLAECTRRTAKLATPTAFRAELRAFQPDVIGAGKPFVWPA